MAYESYNTWRSYTANSPKNYFKDALQAKINQDFQLSMNYEIIQIKNRFTGIFSDIGVRIENYGVETSFYANDEFKRVIFQDMDYSINLGDILEFGGYRWITMQPKSVSATTSSAIVQRCNAVLKFTESTPLTDNIIEIDCLVSNKLNTSVNNNILDIPSGSLFVQAPIDFNSLKIKLFPRPTRFLLGMPDYRGNYRAYKVENLNTVAKSRIDYYAATPVAYMGIMDIFLKECTLDKLRDNQTVGVAYQDYF